MKKSIIFKDVSLKIPSIDVSKRIFFKKNFILKKEKLIGADQTHEKNMIFNNILTNINFEIHEGENISLIGHNGSGKTTLLRLIAGIYEPTSGTIKINGSVISFLNVALALENDATGYENIEIVNRILKNYNINKNQTYKRVESISDLGNFLHLPIKNYSEGMKARLLFSIIILLKADIGVFDEGLNTADENFKNKTKKLILDFFSKIKINIFASHDFELMKKLCKKCFVLKKGRLRIFQSVSEGVDFYRSNQY
jgi:lipopolysaccharide transport system ATP-binding protein